MSQVKWFVEPNVLSFSLEFTVFIGANISISIFEDLNTETHFDITLKDSLIYVTLVFIMSLTFFLALHPLALVISTLYWIKILSLSFLLPVNPLSFVEIGLVDKWTNTMFLVVFKESFEIAFAFSKLFSESSPLILFVIPPANI